MKRILVTILSILYMTAATGATVHIHYCMGRLIKAGFVDKGDDACSKCGMKKDVRKKGCCKDEHKTFKTGDHNSAKAALEFSHKIQCLPTSAVFAPFYNAAPPAVSGNGLPTINAPPLLWYGCPIFIFICNFRI